MAEMTASEAVVLLTGKNPNKTLRVGKLKFPIIELDDAQQIAALIESQQSEINYQNLQIAKLQEDLIQAINGKE